MIGRRSGRELEAAESYRRINMAKKHKVEFDARRKVTKKVPVKFRTDSGENVSFKANKKVQKPVHVKFMARSK
jgi:hypothetical protein